MTGGQILLFLQVLNRHLRSVPDLEHANLLEKCRTAYHIGGIFNNYLLWLERRMQDSPQDMAAAAARILPQGFTPFSAALSTGRRRQSDKSAPRTRSDAGSAVLSACAGRLGNRLAAHLVPQPVQQHADDIVLLFRG